VESQLVSGKVGQFDVEVDGKVVFSKQARGRFPEPAEILDALPG
jgi:selT/selW/selH-like putative selenoprotein